MVFDPAPPLGEAPSQHTEAALIAEGRSRS
jgi:hypothetical protein